MLQSRSADSSGNRERAMASGMLEIGSYDTTNLVSFIDCKIGASVFREDLGEIGKKHAWVRGVVGKDSGFVADLGDMLGISEAKQVRFLDKGRIECWIYHFEILVPFLNQFGFRHQEPAFFLWKVCSNVIDMLTTVTGYGDQIGVLNQN